MKSPTIKATVFPSNFDVYRCGYEQTYDLTQSLAFFGFEMIWIGHPETFIILKKQDIECSSLATLDLYIQEEDMCHLIGRQGSNINSLKRRLNKQICAKPLMAGSFTHRDADYKKLMQQMTWEALPIDTLIDVIRLKNVVHNILYTKHISETNDLERVGGVLKNLTSRPEVYCDHAGYSENVKKLCEQIKENLEPCLVNELCLHLSEMQHNGLLNKDFDYKNLLLIGTFNNNYIYHEEYPSELLRKKDIAQKGE